MFSILPLKNLEGISIPGVFNNKTMSFEMFLKDSLGPWSLKNKASSFEKKVELTS